MAVYHGAIDEFYDRLDSVEIESGEIKELLRTGKQSGFYELCKHFVEIALNAPRIRKEGTCDVAGSFQFADIEKAKKAAKKYMTDHSLSDAEGLMDAVEMMYEYAVEFDDKRKSGIVRPEGYDYQPGFAGIYYNFAQIPDDIWVDIKRETIMLLESKEL